MEPLVYKKCLTTLQVVVDLKSQGDRSNAVPGSEVLANFDGLAEAMKVSCMDERIKVMPFLIRTCFQAYSLAVDTYACKIHNIKIGLHITSCLACSLRSIHSEKVNQNTKIGKHDLVSLFYSQEEIRISCNELLLTVLALLEGLHSFLNGEKKTTALAADYEECCVQCFRVYNSFIQIWMKCSKEVEVVNYLREQPLRGNFLAQIVQICLRFSLHESRRISERALECLFSSICYVNDPNEWRKYFPGCFGGLFAVSTTAGKNRVSSIRLASVICLLRLTILISDDKEGHNVWLLRNIEQSSHAGHAEKECNDNKAAFGALMSELLGADSVGNEQVFAASGIDKNSPRIPPEFVSKEDFMQWRVDLLQRIQKYLPTAFTTAFEAASSAKHCARLQHWLALLLICSSQFLGNHVFVDFTCMFLRGLRHESRAVKTVTRRLWVIIRDRLKSLGHWPSISSLLMEKCVVLLHSLSDTNVSGAAVGSERALLMHLNSAISLGEALGSDLKLALRAAGPNLALFLASMTSPDPQSSHSLTLQSQKYACGPGTTALVGAYYRCSLSAARESSTTKALRTLCMLLGRQGAAMELLTAVGRLQHDLEDIERSLFPGQTAENEDPYSAKAHVGALQRLVGAWQAVSYAILGLAASPTKDDVVDAHTEVDSSDRDKLTQKAGEACALCGSTASLMRCTRCKAVSYCSKEHQAEHWTLAHKMSCKPFHPPSISDYDDGVERLADIEFQVMARAWGDPQLESFIDSTQSTSSFVNNEEVSFLGEALDPMDLLSNPSQALPLRRQQRRNKGRDSMETGLLYPSSQDNVCADNVCRAILIALKYHLSFIKTSSAGQKVQLRALLLSACAETLGNLALLLRSSFQVHLVRCLYHLLELRVCNDSTISHAAATTLDRIGLYMGCSPIGTTGLLRQCFDYFVNDACSRLRALSKDTIVGGIGGINSATSSRRQTADGRTHRVVDFVLSQLSADTMKSDENIDSPQEERRNRDTETDSHRDSMKQILDPESVQAAMEELLLDAVESMDSLAGAGALDRAYSRPLLSMMLVLTERAARDPTLTEQRTQDGRFDAWHWHYLPRTISSLRTFQKAIHVLQERKLENAKNEEEIATKISLSDAKFLGSNGTHLLKLAQEKAERISKDWNAPSRQEHEDEEEEEKGVKEDKNEASSKPLAGLLLVDTILRRCAYYLSLPHLADQVSVLQVMNAAVSRLSTERKLLLPAIHKLWPSLISKLREMRVSMKEEARERAYAGDNTRLLMTQDPSTHRARILALPELLRLVQRIAELAGDFVSIKFSDDVWPELYQLMTLINPPSLMTAVTEAVNARQSKAKETLDISPEASTASPQSRTLRKLLEKDDDVILSAGNTANDQTMVASRSDNRHSLESKIKLSLLSCVEIVAKIPACQSFVRNAVGRCTWCTVPLLSSSQCREVNDGALRVLRSLQALDASLVCSIVQAVTISDNSGMLRRSVLAADPRLSVSFTEVESVYSKIRSDETCLSSLRPLIKVIGPTEIQSLLTSSFDDLLRRHGRI